MIPTTIDCYKLSLKVLYGLVDRAVDLWVQTSLVPFPQKLLSRGNVLVQLDKFDRSNLVRTQMTSMILRMQYYGVEV